MTTNNTYKGYEFFYTNGCSMTAGGGLETPEDLSGLIDSSQYYLRQSLMPAYQEKYGVPAWKTAKDIAWPQRLSEFLGIPCVNEAQNGGSLFRAVRMAWDFIGDNWESRHKMFIVLELPSDARIDLFYEPHQEYFIVNIELKEDGKFHLIYATPDYLRGDPAISDESIQSSFRTYVSNHYDYLEEKKKYNTEILGLYSFCKLHGIQIKLTAKPCDLLSWKGKVHKIHNGVFNKLIPQTDITLTEDSELLRDVWQWSCEKKEQIVHELPELSNDRHPGYFGHLNYAKALKERLDDVLEPSKS